MGDVYRVVTSSGAVVLYEEAEGGGTAVDDLLASGTAEYDVFLAEAQGALGTSWKILA